MAHLWTVETIKDGEHVVEYASGTEDACERWVSENFSVVGIPDGYWEIHYRDIAFVEPRYFLEY